MIRPVGDSRVALSFHPDFLNQDQTWQKIEDFIDEEACGLIAKGYLIPHPSELANNEKAKAAWKVRCDRTVYSNKMEPILSFLVGLFDQEINFGDLAKELKDFLEDATGTGTSAKELHQDKSRHLIQFGKYGVFVDAPPKLTGDRSEDRKSNLRSYQLLYSARQIKDWAYFGVGPKLGKLSRVVVDADPFVAEDGKMIPQWDWFVVSESGLGADGFFHRVTLRCDEEETKAFRESNKCQPNEIICKIVSDSPGQVDYIPFEIVGDGVKDSASMRAATEQARGHFNEESVLGNVNYYTGFDHTVFFGVDSAQVVTKSEANATLIDNPEAHLTQIPAGEPLSLERSLARRDARIVMLMLRQFNKILAEDSKAQQSADSKAQDQKGLVAWCKSSIGKMQKSENRIWTWTADYEGKKVKVEIEINRDFELEDATIQVAIDGVLFSWAMQTGRTELQNEIINDQIEARDWEDEKKDRLKKEKGKPPAVNPLLAPKPGATAKPQLTEPAPV